MRGSDLNPRPLDSPIFQTGRRALLFIQPARLVGVDVHMVLWDVCTYTRGYLYACVRIRACACACVHARVSVYARMRVYARVCACVYAQLRVCARATARVCARPARVYNCAHASFSMYSA